ncbi:proline-specific permease ProY, partial [Streptomyces sp. NPDC056730]
MMILISHIRYRRGVRAGLLPASSFPAPGGSVFSWVAVGFLALVTCLIAYDKDARVSLYVGAVWAVCLVIGWQYLKRRAPRTAAGDSTPEYASAE